MTSRGIVLKPEIVRERKVAVARLTRAGFFASEIAVRVGIGRRTVERYRASVRKECSSGPLPQQ